VLKSIIEIVLIFLFFLLITQKEKKLPYKEITHMFMNNGKKIIYYHDILWLYFRFIHKFVPRDIYIRHLLIYSSHLLAQFISDSISISITRVSKGRKLLVSVTTNHSILCLSIKKCLLQSFNILLFNLSLNFGMDENYLSYIPSYPVPFKSHCSVGPDL